MRQEYARLQKARGEAITALDSLLDAPGKDNDRALSDEEQSRWDSLSATVQELDKKISRDIQLYELKSQQPTIPDLFAGTVSAADRAAMGQRGVPSGSSGAALTEPQRWVDVTSGQQVLCLSKGQKLTDHIRPRSGQYVSPGSLKGILGQTIRAKVLGSWKHAEQAREFFALGSSSDNASGGWLIPEILAPFVIDMARSQSILIQAGMMTVPMESGDLRIARVVGDPSIQTKGENIAFADAGLTFDSLLLVAKMIGCYSICSREMIADAPNAAEVIETTMTRALAAGIDRFGLVGTGAGGQPVGIVNSTQAALNKLAAIGSPLWSDVLDAIAAVQNDNELPSSFVISPTNNSTLSKLLINAEVNHYAPPPSDIEQLTKYVTTAVGDTDAIVGDFTQLLCGLRQDMSVEVTTQGDDTFAKHQVGIKCTLRLDYVLARAGAFCVLQGLTA